MRSLTEVKIIGVLLVLITMLVWTPMQDGGPPGLAYAQSSISGYESSSYLILDADSLNHYTDAVMTDSAYTDSIDISKSQYFGLTYRADVDGADGDSVNYTIQIYVANHVDDTFVLPEAISPVIQSLPAVTDTLFHVRSIKLPPCKFVKFRLLKQVGASDSTTWTMRLFAQPPQYRP